ncbi:MAG: hypothetical protein HRU35_04255 [Rickettsiaceae bacterium]|nr:hypothetical protein [Rickettsiaceae bacterium]
MDQEFASKGDDIKRRWAEYTFGDLSKVPGDFIEDQVENYLDDKNYSPEELIFHLKLNSLINHETNEIRKDKQQEFQQLINDNEEIIRDGDKLNLLNNQLKNNKISVLIKNMPFKGFGVKIGKKEGGIHKSDPLGGRYKKDGKTYLLKRDIDHPEHDISEFLGAKIMGAVAPGSCCEIDLVKSKDSFKKGKFSYKRFNRGEKAQKVFLASKFVDKFEDFHKTMGSKEKRHPNRERRAAANRGKNPNIKYDTNHHLKNKDYKGYAQAFVSRLWVRDYSVHSGNFGIREMQQDDLGYKKGDLVYTNIDPGAAFRKANFANDINPFKSIKSKWRRGHHEKNYFLRDHPKEKIFSKEFSEELKKVAQEDIEEVVEEAWKEVCDNFDDKTIKKFGKQIGVSDDKLDKDNFKEEIHEHFSEKMKARQESLLNMAFEIDLDIALSKPTQKEQEEALKKVFSDPEYQKGDDDYYLGHYLPQMLDNPKLSQTQREYTDEEIKLVKKVSGLDIDAIDLTLDPKPLPPRQLDDIDDNLDVNKNKKGADELPDLPDVLYSELKEAINEYLNKTKDNAIDLREDLEEAINGYDDSQKGYDDAKKILEEIKQSGQEIDDDNIEDLEEVLKDFIENSMLYGKPSNKNVVGKTNSVTEPSKEPKIIIPKRLKEDPLNKAYKVIDKLNEKTKDVKQDLVSYKSAILKDEELKELMTDDLVRSTVKKILNEQINAADQYNDQQIYKDGTEKLKLFNDAIKAAGAVIKAQSHIPTIQQSNSNQSNIPIDPKHAQNKAKGGGQGIK